MSYDKIWWTSWLGDNDKPLLFWLIEHTYQWGTKRDLFILAGGRQSIECRPRYRRSYSY